MRWPPFSLTIFGKMNIALMRHGPAEPERAGHSDAQRRLTGAGRHRIAIQAAALRAGGFDFTRILSSPLIRCVETAEIIGSVLNVEVERDALLALDASSDDFLEVISRLDASERPLIVAHQPEVESLVHLWTGASIFFEPGTFVLCETSPSGRTARLRDVLSPQVQLAIGHQLST